MRTTRSGRPAAPPSMEAAAVLVHPDQILDHPSMSLEEKRTTLSSWASDHCAVENAPALRRLPNGAVVPVDDILAALAGLPIEAPQIDQVLTGTASDRRQRPLSPPWRKVLTRTRGSAPPPRGGAAALRLVPAVNMNA